MQSHTYQGIREFTDKTREALVSEKEEEITQFKETVRTNTAKELELMGLAITALKLKSSKGGLYGRTLFTLQHHLFPNDENTPKHILEKFKLPESRFGVGDNVGIYSNTEYIQDKPLATGVVHKRSEYKVVISIDSKEGGDEVEGEVWGNTLSVCCTINEVTYHRYEKVLEALEKTDHSHKSKHIIDALFNYVKFPDNLDSKPLQFVDQTLNEIQKQAVTQCIATGSVHLVHGPPGTGKTKTICEVIVQAAKKGWKVLATAGSNIAVDNIVERVGKKVKVCRIGHPSRMIESVYDYCLDNLLYKSSFTKVTKDLKRELDQKRTKYSKTSEKAQRRDLRDEIKSMRSEIRGIEEAAINEILSESEVICCTNTGAGERMFRYQLSKSTFDLVVIDQCAQSVQVSCWIPLLKGKKAVLAGDHLQLPPTIKSSKAEKILGYTLFDRAMKQCPVGNTLLTIQYRMNKLIMNWSSKQFYQGKLQADTGVSDHNMKQISASVVNSVPIMFIDTEGCQMGENINKETSDINKSKYNVGEADVVRVVVEELIQQGLMNQHIGIISPYNAQVSLIKNSIEHLQKEKSKIQVSTVDGFQGREKECIIISMVRSNPVKQVGFLSDYRRMNVAITRAKRFVCLIGDSSTVSSDASLKSLVEYFSENGELRNAIEFKVDQNVRFGSGWIKHDKEKDKGKEQGKDKEKPITALTKGNSEKQGQGKKKKNKKKESIKNQKDTKQEEKWQGPGKTTQSFQPMKQAEQKYIPQIQIFLTSKQKELVFQNLSGFDRKIVHQIAEEFKLQHQTSPDKTKLVLRKNIPVEIDQVKRNQLEELAKCPGEEFVRYTELSAGERKELIKIAHKLTLMTEFDNEINELIIKTKIEKEFNIQKPKPKPKKKKDKSKVVEEEEFDEIAFLEQLEAQEKKCNFKEIECKSKVEHLGMRCQFCQKMFCVKHCLAETHGCGERAQAHALEKHKAQFIKYTDDYISDKDRNALRQKLQKKIKESQKGRTQQVKKQKK